tara:strand:+ start:1467 stop:2813 length:1347 start_codon:yes stop_codon:yes gene_type:complete
MATIEIKESPVAATLSQIPDLLMRAAELRSRRELQEAQENRLNQQFLMNQNMNMMKQSEHALNMELKKQQLGMDAAGYNNLEVIDYFNNLLLDEGVIESAGGYLNWTGNTIMPTHQEAWNNYKDIVTKGGKSITSGDYRLFNSNWAQLVQSKNDRFKGQIGKLVKQGYDTSDVEELLTENPIFAANISNLERYTDAESQAFYAGFQPKKSRGLVERMADNPIKTSATISAGLLAPSLAVGGYKWLTSPAEELKNSARLIYNDELNSSRNAVSEARKLVQEEKAKASYKGKAANVRAAESILDEAKENHRLLQRTSVKDYQKALKEGTRWGKASKYLPKSPGMLRGMVPAVAGTAGGAIGGFVGGEEGAAVGRGFGGGVAMAAGGVPLTRYIAQRLAAKAPSIAAKFKLIAMADSPAIGYADLFGAALSLGLGGAEVISAYKDWQKANR